MPKSTISFRVEAKLLAQFCNAALEQNRVPMDVLIEFITTYVHNERDRRLVMAVDSHLSGELARALNEHWNENRRLDYRNFQL